MVLIFHLLLKLNNLHQWDLIRSKNNSTEDYLSVSRSPYLVLETLSSVLPALNVGRLVLIYYHPIFDLVLALINFYLKEKYSLCREEGSFEPLYPESGNPAQQLVYVRYFMKLLSGNLCDRSTAN